MKQLILAVMITMSYFQATWANSYADNLDVHDSWNIFYYDVAPIKDSTTRQQCEALIAQLPTYYSLQKIKSSSSLIDLVNNYGPHKALFLEQDEQKFNMNGKSEVINVTGSFIINSADTNTMWGIIKIGNICSSKAMCLPAFYDGSPKK